MAFDLRSQRYEFFARMIAFMSLITMSVPVVAESDGIDLLAQACAHQGQFLIKVGRAEMEVSLRTEEPTPEEIEAEIEVMRQGIQSQIDQSDDEASRRLFEQGLKNVETHRAEIEGQIRARADRRLKVSILFDSPDLAGRRRISFSRFDSAKDRWEAPVDIIRGGVKTTDAAGMYFEPQDGTAVLGDGKIGIDVQDPFQIGRLQGETARMATLAFSVGTDPKNLKPTPETVQAFRNQMKELAATGRARPYQIVERLPFESSFVDVIETQVAIGEEWRTSFRVWIDSARGFVCPLIQEFTLDGHPLREWKSSEYFLDEPSGLWFPSTHTFQEWNANSSLKRREHYTIIRDTLRLNEPVSDEEFSIDLPQGISIVDSRSGGQRFSTTKPVNISLRDLRDGLAKLKGVRVSEGGSAIAPYGNLTKAANSSSLRGGIIIFNLVLAAAALVFFGYRKYRSRGSSGTYLRLILIATFSELAIGCSEEAPPQSRQDVSTAKSAVIAAIPAAVDFGVARESFSGVAYDIQILNQGVEPVVLERVVPSCGCTVLEFSSQVLAGNAAIYCPLQIKTVGRAGPFRSHIDLFYKVAKDRSARLLRIPIHGKIVQDMWASQPSLRFASDGSRGRLSATLTLHVVREKESPSAKGPEIAIFPDATSAVRILSRGFERLENEDMFDYLVEVDLGAADPAANYYLQVEGQSDAPPLRIPVFIDRGQNAGAERVGPSTISVGVLRPGETRVVKVFGQPKLLRELVLNEVIGLSEEAHVSLLEDRDISTPYREIAIELPRRIADGPFALEVVLNRKSPDSAAVANIVVRGHVISKPDAQARS